MISNRFKKHTMLFFLSFFYIGFISKKMPGTVGSIFATLMIIPILNYKITLLILFLLTFIFGTIFAQIYIMDKKYEDNRDPSYMVIDEVCGMLCGAYILNLFGFTSIKAIIINFILFRIFDILKPFPIKNIESILKKKDNTVGFGIMFDDVLASIAATSIQIIFFRYF